MGRRSDTVPNVVALVYAFMGNGHIYVLNVETLFSVRIGREKQIATFAKALASAFMEDESIHVANVRDLASAFIIK